MSSPATVSVEHQTIGTNGVLLHVAVAGDPAATPVILLHGFPEFWYGWRYQIPALAEAGYRVLAPDQRGYNLSDKPAGLDAYRLDALAADVIGLIDSTGRDRVFLIGHDWGAAVAWWTAMRYPDRIEKLVILNVPHPVVMLDMLNKNPRQMLKSWYIGFIQIPRLPEALLGFGGAYGLANMMLAASTRGSLNDADIVRYISAWTQPGALTGMLNWYRALTRRRPAMPADPRIRVPTLILWGEQDIALVPELADASAALCDDVRLIRFPNASHFVQHDEPAAVNAAILEFLKDSAED
jgi:pimeloyl-ACP methyl ester carboxylesterase